MGADFIYTTIPCCKYTVDRHITLVWSIEEELVKDCPDFGDSLNNWVEDSGGAITYRDAAEILVDHLAEYWQFRRRRDLDVLRLPTGHTVYISGGLSSGDLPTEACEIMVDMEFLYDLLETFCHLDINKGTYQ